MTRDPIAFARRLCYEIAGPTDEDDTSGSGYGSIDCVTILGNEVERLRAVIDAAPHDSYCKARRSDWRWPCDCFKSQANPPRDA